MSELALIAAIASFCQLKNPKVPLEYRDDCMHYVANCSIIEDGKMTNSRLDECKKLWILKSETK